MFQGLRTIIYHATDLAETRDWYASVLDQQPYFDQPFYVGFNVGGYELGIDHGTPDVAGTTTYWGVPNAGEAYARLLSLGATALEEPRDVGEGIMVATVADPFGNKVGIIENPHFTGGA